MESGFFSGSALIGIQSQDAGYHLCWKINEQFDFNFTCDPDTCIAYKKNESFIYFPVFQYVVPNSSELFLLYQVKRTRLMLLDKLKKTNWLYQADYIWLHKTSDSLTDARNYVKELMNIPGVLYAHIIEQDQVKLLHNLVI
jgi:hypothetical protein